MTVGTTRNREFRSQGPSRSALWLRPRLLRVPHARPASPRRILTHSLNTGGFSSQVVSHRIISSLSGRLAGFRAARRACSFAVITRRRTAMRRAAVARLVFFEQAEQARFQVLRKWLAGPLRPSGSSGTPHSRSSFADSFRTPARGLLEGTRTPLRRPARGWCSSSQRVSSADFPLAVMFKSLTVRDHGLLMLGHGRRKLVTAALGFRDEI